MIVNQKTESQSLDYVGQKYPSTIENTQTRLEADLVKTNKNYRPE